MYPTPGIIARLKTLKTSDWLTAISAEEATLLDTLIKARYGQKHLNTLGQMLDDDGVDNVAYLLWVLHSTQWDRLWSAYVAEYNPIWNVDGTESETVTRNLEQNDSGTDTYVNSGTDSSTKTGTDTLTNTGTNTSEDFVFGVDSTTGVPSDKTVNTPDLTNETEYDTTEELTHGKTTTNTKALKHTDEGSVTTVRERGGNIGVTMTQDMLQKDKDYWSDLTSLFYEHIIRDIVNDITYKIYTD